MRGLVLFRVCPVSERECVFFDWIVVMPFHYMKIVVSLRTNYIHDAFSDVLRYSI